MQSEVSIMRSLDYKYVVKLHDVYEDKKHLYLVMEECRGFVYHRKRAMCIHVFFLCSYRGELYEQIVKRGHFTERHCARIIQMILEGLQVSLSISLTAPINVAHQNYVLCVDISIFMDLRIMLFIVI